MKTKLKIFFGLDQLNVGGKEKRALSLIENLDSKNYEKFVINFGSKNDQLYDLYKENSSKIIICNRKFKWDIIIFFKLGKLIKIYKPDLIISFDWMSAFYLRRISSIFNIPFVNASITGATKKKSIRKIIKSHDLKKSKYVISNSLAGLKSYNLVKSNHNLVIYNGINISRALESLKKVNKCIELGVVGNLTDTRNHILILKSLLHLIRKKYNTKLTIVGDGPNKSSLILLAKKLNLSKNITFLGHVKNVDITIQKFDICLHASYFATGEGFSNTIMEYMLQSKPIVSTHFGGTKELLTNEEGAFLVSDEEKEYSRAIEKLIVNKDLREKMGKFNFEYIKSNLTIDKMVAKYDSFFNSVINKNND